MQTPLLFFSFNTQQRRKWGNLVNLFDNSIATTSGGREIQNPGSPYKVDQGMPLSYKALGAFSITNIA